MDFPLKELAGAAATIVVGLLAYRQWKRSKRSGAFLQDRETAYKSVWQSLEEVHLYVRKGEFVSQTFDRLVQDANTNLIRHGLHVEEGDRALAQTYIRALEQLGQALDQTEHAEFKRSMAATMESHPVPADYVPAVRAYEKAREELMISFRRALGAGQI